MLAPLTSLRFFAAFAIVVHHAAGHFLPIEILMGWPLDQGVSFFFVLSGFVLTHAYSDLTFTRTDLQNFFVARIARIWPAHIFAIVILLTLVGTSRVDGAPPSFLLNVLLLQGWVPVKDIFFSFNGLSWTVSTELGFYVLFPLLIHRWSETWWWKLTLAAALLAGLMVICTKLNIPNFQFDYNGITNSAFSTSSAWAFVRVCAGDDDGTGVAALSSTGKEFRLLDDGRNCCAASDRVDCSVRDMARVQVQHGTSAIR